MREDTKVSQ